MPEPDMTDHNVVSGDRGSVVGNANTVARGGLTGDGDEGRVNSQALLQVNGAGNREDYYSRFFSEDCLSQASPDRRAILVHVVFQSGDHENLSPSSSKSICAE